MLLKRALWVVAACAAVGWVVWQPLISAAAVSAFLGVSTAIVLPPRWGLTVGLIGAETVLVLVPTTQLQHIPGGSLFMPILAFCFLVFGLIKQHKDVHAKTSFKVLTALYIVTVASTFAVGTIDWFYLPLGVIGPLVYLSAVNLPEAGRRVMIRYSVGMALFQTAIAIPEVLRGMGPFIGTQIPITVKNPFIPAYDRAQGTLDHPLVLSIVLLIGLSFLHALKIRGAFKVLLGAFLLVGLFLTGSTSTAVSTAIVVLWTLADRKSMLGRFVVRAGFVIILVYVVLGNVSPEKILGDELNVAHRTGSVAAIPNLLTMQEPYQVILGNGFGTVKPLFERGLISNDGFYVIDNEFVSVLVASGIVGLALFVWLLWAAFRRAPRELKPSVAVLLFMTVSFDYLLWYSLLVPLFLVIGMSLSEKPASKAKAPMIVKPPRMQEQDLAVPAVMIGRHRSGVMR